MPSMKYIHCQPCNPIPLICSNAPDSGPEISDDGRAAKENSDGLAAFDTGQPACEVVDDAREEAGFSDAQQKTQNVEMGFSLDKGHGSGYQAPRQHDARQPNTCADLLQEDVGGDFEQRVSDKKQSGAQTVGGSADTQVVLHVAANEADIDPIDVVDDEHDDEQRQYAALHFRYCRKQR